MSRDEIVVFGSVVQDLVSYVDRYPKPGESVRGKKFQMYNGGKGANQAYIIAKLGGNATLIANVGNDIFGDSNINGLSKAGVQTDSMAKTDGTATGTATINVDYNGENCIVVTLGANMTLNPERVQQLEDVISKAYMIMAQNEVPQESNIEAFKVAKKHGVRTFFNPAPGLKDLDSSILPLTDIICTNENEAEFITGLTLSTVDDFKQAALKIVQEVGPKVAIITLGPQGALVAQKLEDGQVKLDKVDAPKVTAVDTVGAGDCFCGSFAYILASQPALGPVEAARKAVQIAAISVTRPGPQASYPSMDEVKAQGIL